MNETEAKLCLKFFLLTLFDQSTALEMANRSARHYQEVSLAIPGISSEIALLRAMNKTWIAINKKGKYQVRREAPDFVKTSPSEYWTPWKKALSKMSVDDSYATICSCVLGFSYTSIAEALELTEGTIRHRIAQGVSVLGDLLINV